MSSSRTKRTWLNPKGGANSYVSYSFYERSGSPEFTLSDCNRVIRIHGYLDGHKSKRAFAKKIRLIANHATELAELVESWTPPKDNEDW